MNVGRALKIARKARGMSIADLCRLGGCSAPQLYDLESGRNPLPRMRTVVRLSAHLDLPVILFLFLAMDDDELKSLPEDSREVLEGAIVKTLGTRISDDYHAKIGALREQISGGGSA